MDLELFHLFGEKITKNYVDEYDREYTATKDCKGRNTLYKKSCYGGNYATVAKGLKNIKEYVKTNELKEVV